MGELTPGPEPVDELELTARLGLRPEEIVETRAARGGIVLKVVHPESGEAFALKVSPAPDPTEPLAKSARRREALVREAQVLRELGGSIGARFVAEGDLGPKRWLLTRWVEGERLGRYRRLVIAPAAGGTERRRLVVDVAVRFLSAVADLHTHGYVHGDLQPDHAVRDPTGAIHLLDFELTHRPGDPDVPYRGGLAHFDAPEVAAGLLAGAERIPFDEAAEVYAAAAVLFLVATGVPPGAYDPDASIEQMLEAIAAGRRRTFREAGAGAFPELERVLDVGLARDRERRYPSIAAMLGDIVAIPT